MVKLVTCPGCTTQLMLPEGATLSDDARCPRCSARFPLMESVHVTLPMAELLPPLEVENSAGYALEPDFELPQLGPKNQSTREETSAPAEFESMTLESFAQKIGGHSETNAKTASHEEVTPEMELQSPGEDSLGELPAGEEPPEKPLSSWEQRLKRALADDVPLFSAGDKPLSATEEEQAEKLPPGDATEQFAISIPDFNTREKLPAKAATQLEEDSPPPDFEVPASDLFPTKPSPSPAEEVVPYSQFESAEGMAEPDEGDATVRFTADQTVSNYRRANVPSETESPPEPVAESHDAREVFIQRANRAGRRRPSLAKLTMSLALGTVGIPLGLYALLWLRGPQADVAHLGSVLPQFMLPASMHRGSQGQPDLQPSSSLVADDANEPQPLQQPASGFIEDPEVQEASATSTVDEPDGQEATYQGPIFAGVSSDRFRELFGDCIEATSRLEAEGFSDRAEKASKVKAFMHLCQLAEMSSYLNQPGLSASESRLANEARTMYAELLSNSIVQRDLPQIVGPWWNYETRSSQGILLVGQVVSSESTPAGQLLEVHFSDQNQSYDIPVLVGRDAPQQGQWAGFVGTILEDPAGQLPALGTALPQIAVVHYAFSVPQSP